MELVALESTDLLQACTWYVLSIRAVWYIHLFEHQASVNNVPRIWTENPVHGCESIRLCAVEGIELK